jgi:Ion channel
MMLRNLLVGLPTVLACMALQVAFAFWSVRYYLRHTGRTRTGAGAGWLGIGPVLVAVLAMFVGTIVQIVLWGTVFLALGEFDEAYEAYYHSAVNFSSLGYGDVVMSKPWKLLGPLEAVCGVLMLGMTAAALMAILQHMIKVQRGIAD